METRNSGTRADSIIAKCGIKHFVRVEADGEFLWQELGVIAANTNGPWMVVGDFNSYLHPHENEKKGGNGPNHRSMQGFSSCVSSCNLTDLEYKGSVFTWTRDLVKIAWTENLDWETASNTFSSSATSRNKDVFGNVFNKKKVTKQIGWHRKKSRQPG
ncbi:reverse transcriptase [Senna tora]|uniref:Reverse transcriptase n=1 Tax=Senna tora TaxID=362788 RepID=A0A834XHP0_9FABA|nr:reverse transcriptase [Senna tora]